jgi:hypothetical protein
MFILLTETLGTGVCVNVDEIYLIGNYAYFAGLKTNNAGTEVKLKNGMAVRVSESVEDIFHLINQR